VSRRLALVALALHFSTMIIVLGSELARAAEPSPKVVRLGFVSPLSPSTDMQRVGALKERLRELGYVEGQNLVIDARWAEGRIDRLAPLMAEMVERKVDVLVTYSTPGGVAARKATSTIPIVLGDIGDAVAAGLAVSLARPGGNVTGMSLGMDKALGGKYLEFLQDSVPNLSRVGLIGNPASPYVRRMAEDLQTLAVNRGLNVWYFKVLDSKELDSAMDQARRQTQAVVVIPDPLTREHSKKITALAAKHRLPAVYGLPEFIDAGGLMVYSVDPVMLFRRTAEYVDKILKGARPADMPFEQPTKLTLTVNLKTARALGLTIPDVILLRADEVIR
jgi:putative tryptophan/tyrosine transport system substrate-binding protein